MTAKERRLYARYAYDDQVTIDGALARGTDISRRGMAVRMMNPPRPGQVVRVALAGPDHHQASGDIAGTALVIRVTPTGSVFQVGLEFTETKSS
jgi:hypothetical protein